MKKLILISLVALAIQTQAQNVGIGNSAPAEKLDVTGNINLTGTIKVNGVAGTSGQILTTTGSALAWSNATLAEPTYSIGDFAQGGVVFWVNAARTHGKVVNVTDIVDVPWSNVTTIEIGAGAKSAKNGAGNTVAITQQTGHERSAASICADFAYGGYDDWYLPSADELLQVFYNRTTINTTAVLNGGENFGTPYYWTSTELSDVNARGLSFIAGLFNPNPKTFPSKVRPIRAF